MTPRSGRLRSPLRRPLRRLARGYLEWRIGRRRRPLESILILSHARSGSTLLTHILATHPEITGFGETFTTYRSAQDLPTLATTVFYVLRRLRTPGRYVVDKLLYDRLLAAPELLQREDVHPLFLLREPHGVLSSTSTRLIFPELGSAPPEGAYLERLGAYYGRRLATLESYARRIGPDRRGLFLTYEQLLTRSDEVFAALGRYLGVEHLFSERYDVLRTTGRQGGDRSANIRSGRILRRPARIGREVPAPLLAAAAADFERCRRVLARHCHTIDGAPATPSGS